MVHSLSKTEEPVSLGGNAESGALIEELRVGLGWDKSGGMSGGFLARAKRAKGADLDLIAVLMKGDEPLAYAGFDSLNPEGDGTVTHSGDNASGVGEGDDETVTCKLGGLHGIDGIVFVGGALKKGTSMEQASNIKFNVYNRTEKVATYRPSLLQASDAMAIAKVFKLPDGSWSLKILEQEVTVSKGDFKSVLRACQGL